MEQPNTLEILLKKIWPSIYRVNTIIFSFTLRFVIDGIKRIISQIKGASA
jgi:hypothetical protein